MAKKLRRDRETDEDGAIKTSLPTAEEPASRVVVAEPVALDSRVLDARERPVCAHCKGKGAHTVVTTGGPGMMAYGMHGAQCILCGGSGFDSFQPSDVTDRIICGDAAASLRKVACESVTCAITSPPYWNLVDYGVNHQIGGSSYDAYRAALLKIWKEVERTLKPNGKFCLNVPLMPLAKKVSAEAFGKTHTRMLLDLPGDLKADILEHTDLRYYSFYIWEKQTTEKMFGSYPYPPNLLERNYCEFILVFVKPGKPTKMDKEVKEAAKLTSEEWMELTKQIWWMYPENVKRKTGHPAPFPESLPNRLISMYSFPRTDDYEGDLVLDPLAGWGTTCRAAKRLGRRFVGIDLSPEFCNEAIERLEQTPVEPKIMWATQPSKKTDA